MFINLTRNPYIFLVIPRFDRGNNMTNIPLLIVGKDLADLADDMGEQGALDGVCPIVADNAEEALSVYSEFGPGLMAIVLHPEEQEAFERLKAAGYKGAFLIYGHETKEWRRKEVTFLDPEQSEAKIYDKIMEKLLE
jgi:hypothetical protein